MDPKTYKFDTLSLHAGYQPEKNAGSRQVPIYQTTSYLFDDVDHLKLNYCVGRSWGLPEGEGTVSLGDVALPPSNRTHSSFGWRLDNLRQRHSQLQSAVVHRHRYNDRNRVREGLQRLRFLRAPTTSMARRSFQP